MYIQQIEAVQRKFTRLLNYRFRFSMEEYPNRLLRYSMISLEQRRVLTDETVLYKIVNGIIHTDVLSELYFRFYSSNLRGRLTLSAGCQKWQKCYWTDPFFICYGNTTSICHICLFFFLKLITPTAKITIFHLFS
jgi:hypothetical protein